MRKFRVGIASFSYGGNGGIKSEVPDVRDWMLKTFLTAVKDPRVENIGQFDIADTPITMGRNQAVLHARQEKFDALIMVDSDMKPDCEPDGKPFWDEAFSFFCNHYDKGPCVIGAPYGGPPPHENVYVFRWRNNMNDSASPDFKLSQYTREEASIATGISPVAALPTGMILYDMRIFNLIEPRKKGDKPWFYYEWKNLHESEKASTEDVTNTRDISLIGIQKLGYNPVYCAWDCWAGHWKPYLVRKPRMIFSDDVSQKFADAVHHGISSDQRTVHVGGSHYNQALYCKSVPQPT